MVYRLTSMNKKTKVIFFFLIWLFSAFCAVVGTLFIATAAILPNTPYDIHPSHHVLEIRQNLGPFETLAYFDPEIGEIFWGVSIVEGVEEFQLVDENNVKIGPLIPWNLIEVHRNGSVFYLHDPGMLVFEIFNETSLSSYEVEAKPEHLKIDISRKQLTLSYQPGHVFEIHRRFISFTDTATTEEEKPKVDFIGRYFIVENRGWAAWFREILQALWQYSWDAFLLIGRIILFTVAIGGGFGILFAFILIIPPFRLSRLFGSKYSTFIILKALHGKIGKILSYIPIFDFIGDFFVDERLIDVIDFSGIRPTISELYKQRWYDILLFPTALASILTIFFVQNYPGDKMEALIWSPILTPIVLILILIYYPLIFAFNEGGFKRMRLSPQGDIVSVKPLGNILRDGLGIVIGFSGILSLGALAYEINTSTARQVTTTGQIQVAGFSFDVFSILLLILWTLGLFFILLGSSFVGASILAVNYLQSSHLDTIEYIRSKSEEKGVVANWGSVTYQFSPMATKAIFEKT